MSDHGTGDPTKHPRLAELEAAVRDGRIDTIVVAFTDMQGRLMGKRVHGEAFLDGVISHGAHFCTYLLGTDMEMNTPEGFRLMNWETGYGDWVAEPVWDQLRELPWLPGTALVLAETVSGGLVLLFLTPLWTEVRRGFFTLTGGVLLVLSLATWGAAAAGSDNDRWAVGTRRGESAQNSVIQRL